MSNTIVFEHAGKTFVTAENYMPQEEDISTLEARGNWNFDKDWNQPFTSHPLKAHVSRELVNMGINDGRPYYVTGVISGNLLYLDFMTLSHSAISIKDNTVNLEIGKLLQLMGRNSIIRPISSSIGVFSAMKLVSYIGEHSDLETSDGKDRGDAILWRREFSSMVLCRIKLRCTFHIFTCFEDGCEVVVRGCRALTSVFLGPDWGMNKFDWFSRGFDFKEPVDANTNKHGD